MKKALLISGSNSQKSINFQLICALEPLCERFETTLFDLRKLDLPLYNVDHEIHGIPEAAQELRTVFEAHDVIIMSVPEFNGSMPAFFKNVLDWLSRVEAPDYRYFSDKIVVVLNTSPGTGGDIAIRHSRDIVEKLGCTEVVSMHFPKFYHAVAQEGDRPVLKDSQLAEAFRELIKDL